MAPLSTRQKNAVSQLMEITGASESTAKTLMKKYNYEVDQAMNAYLDQAPSSRPRTSTSNPASPAESAAKLQALFENYKTADDAKDETSIEGTMKYMEELGVMEDAAMLIGLEIVQSPSMGVMKKQAFVDGWIKATVDAKKHLDTIAKQKAYIATLKSRLSSDIGHFRKVYRYTFISSKESDTKALSKDFAIVYWNMLFCAPGIEWKTAQTNWLELWIEYIEKNWTKTVSKDMWNQTAEFALKSINDDELSFYSEEGAWPSVIDEFVAWVKEKRGTGDKMETD